MEYAQSVSSQLNVNLDELDLKSDASEEKKEIEDPMSTGAVTRRFGSIRDFNLQSNNYDNVLYSDDQQDEKEPSARCCCCHREFAAYPEISFDKIYLKCPFCGELDPIWKSLEKRWLISKFDADKVLTSKIVALHASLGWSNNFKDEMIEAELLIAQLTKRLAELNILETKKVKEEKIIHESSLNDLKIRLEDFKESHLVVTLFERSLEERIQYNKNILSDKRDSSRDSSRDNAGFVPSLNNNNNDLSVENNHNNGNNGNVIWETGMLKKYCDKNMKKDKKGEGYGFICSDYDGSDVYFHSGEIENYYVINGDRCLVHPSNLDKHRYTPVLEKMRRVKYVRKFRPKGTYAAHLHYADGALIEAYFSCKLCVSN